MSNKARRPWIQDIRSTAGQKMLQDQMDWMWGQLMGNIPEKALGTLFQNKVNSKVGSTEFQTYITQTAEQIALLATQESVNESLEDLATDLNTLTAVADGSLTIWYSATEPAGKVQYDIWFRTTPQPYLIQRWIGGVWVNISSTATARTLVLAYGAQKTADGKIKVYRQTTAPTGLTAIDDGDLWFDTDDSNKLYAWNGSTLAWVSAQDTHLDGDVSAMKTEIIQAANVLRLRASLEETDDLGVAIETVMSEVLITAGNITAEVTNKTHHFGALPPALEDLYLGKLWVKSDTDEHLWWRNVTTNTSRSYENQLSGAEVRFSDLSDKTELEIEIRYVTQQETGTPTLTSPKGLTGRDYYGIAQDGETIALLYPSASMWGLPTLADSGKNSGEFTHNTVYFSLDGSLSAWYDAGNVGASTRLYGIGLYTTPGITSQVTLSGGLCNRATDVGSQVFSGGTYQDTGSTFCVRRVSGTDYFRLFIRVPTALCADLTAWKAWLNSNPLQLVCKLETPQAENIGSIQINGVFGENIISSNGTIVIVDYLGSGWGLVSRESRRVYASSKFIIDENGATVRHVLLDGITPYEAYTHLYGGGLEIFEESTGEFIGGLCVRGGKVVLAASALTDPRVSTNFMLSPYTIEGGSATEFGVKLSKGDAEALTISTSTPNADPDNPSSARIKSPEIIEILSGASYTGAYSRIDMRPTGTMYIVVKKMSGGTPLYTGFAFNVTDERIEITGHLVPPTNGGYSIGTPSLGFNYYYGTHTSIQSTSDERAKRDMHTLDPDTMLRFIMALDATWYRLNVAPEDLMAGFRAQQFLEAMKLAGIPLDYAGFNGKDSDHLALDYCQVIAPLVSAFQSQQRRIDTIERKLNTFMRRNGPA